MMTEKVIYAPEIRLFTHHLRILKTTSLTEAEQEIYLSSMIAYYLRLLADYGLVDSLIKQLKKEMLSPLSILDSWLQYIDTIQVFLWWGKLRIIVLEIFIDLTKYLSSQTLEYVIHDYLFRSDFEWLTTANIPFFQFINSPGKIGIQRVNLPPKYRGFFYPQYINDSYSFLLHVFHPQKPGKDGVRFSDLAQLRPRSHFLREPRQP